MSHSQQVVPKRSYNVFGSSKHVLDSLSTLEIAYIMLVVAM